MFDRREPGTLSQAHEESAQFNAVMRAAKLNNHPSVVMQQATELRTHPLYPQLMSAIEQAMYGKGERHGGARTPFLEQPWLHYAEMHGRGFLTGQAAKKLEEAASTKTGDAFVQEIRGAIVYLGMTLIYHEMVQKREAAQDT